MTIRQSYVRSTLIPAVLGTALLATAVPASPQSHQHPSEAGTTQAGLSVDGSPPVAGKHSMMMMRPDMRPPSGIMAAMSPDQGGFMLSAGYMRMGMTGNRDGTSRRSTQQVLGQFPVAPLNMDMDMFMIGGMYGITDDLKTMLMVPFLNKEMDHVTRMGTRFTTHSSGIGDVRVLLGYDVFKEAGHKLELTGGVSFPTGSTGERDATPAGPNSVLPYPMQNGSGTFDLVPGLAYTGFAGDWSWGGNFDAVIRLGENDEGYSLGDRFTGSVWGAYRWTNWFSTSVRVTGELVGNIDGADPRLNAALVPTADPDLRAGRFVGVAAGANFIILDGVARGVRLSVEGMLPVYQNLDGPQLERDFAVMVNLSKMF